jgi:dipeptidyl aminopeptidase/acylaminoacyl peptidase
MLVEINARDKKVFDVYRVNLETGEARLDTQNPGDVAAWATDASFQIRACQGSSPSDGSQTLRVRDNVTAPWRDLITWPAEENGGLIGIAPDGKSIYVDTSIGSDVARVARVDAATGKELETLASNPRCDAGVDILEPGTHKLQAVSFTYERRGWRVLDPAVKDDFDALAKAHAGELTLIARDLKDDKWTVSYTQDDGPVQYAVYDRATRKIAPLFVDRPELEKYTLARMDPVTIPTRDGLEMVSYLTLPAGIPGKALPLVLFVHGGPWGRDNWGFDATAQWLANRGYAVLQVNFRASTGFGKKFLHAGDRQWGLAMQNDLSDAVKWAIAKGVADPKRVAIFGGSYGGYATLAGLTFTPELYACGVDIVGPSNLKTLLEATPPYWATLRKMLYLRMGDVDQDSVFNRKVSPMFHVDQVRAPLLIGQGQNDPRVNIRESNQMVEAMRAKGLPVEYVVYSDEGHGFARPDNRLDFYGRAETFLAKYVGGRAEAFTSVDGATASLK